MQPIVRRTRLVLVRAATLALCAALPVVATACRDDASPTGPNVPAEEPIAQVAARLTAMEREKHEIAFGTPVRTPAQIARFVSMYAPEFRSIDLGPTGVTQTRYADLVANVSSFPTMPFVISDVSTAAVNAQSMVVTYRVALQTPMGELHYLASSTWARRASGEWQTVFYQATPL